MLTTKFNYIIKCCLFFFAFFPVSIQAAGQDVVPQHDKISQGITKLSPYFSIELTGGNWYSPLLLKTYHHDNGDKKIIGLTRFSEFGSRQNGYAISKDGKTILYFHQKLPDDGGVNKSSGLYEYRHDKGDRQINRFVSNAVFLPIKLPKHILAYAQLEKIKDSMRLDSKNFIRDTEGNEKPWQP